MMRMMTVQGIKKTAGSLTGNRACPAFRHGSAGAALVVSIGALLIAPPAEAATYTWDAGGGLNTNWTKDTNWAPNVDPSFVAGDTFRLDNVNLAAPGAISTMNNDRTLRTVRIGDTDGTHSWTLNSGAGDVLTLASGGSGAAVINQTSGSAGDTISIATIRLNSNLRLDNAATAVLTVASGITSGTAGLKQVINSDASEGNVTLSGVIGNGSGQVEIVQNSSLSTLTLLGANTFTGTTTVSAGTLAAAAAGALGGTSSVAVSSGGTLLLAGAGNIDRVNNGAALSLGGTLSMQGLSSATEIMGTLTLSGNSTIDFGTGNTNTLAFDSLSLGGFTLAVRNWTGTFYTAGETADHGPGSQDRLLFSISPSLSEAQLSQISFFNDAGAFIGTAKQVSFGGTPELVPIPEPASVFSALALLGLAGYRERRRLLAFLPARLPTRA